MVSVHVQCGFGRLSTAQQVRLPANGLPVSKLTSGMLMLKPLQIAVGMERRSDGLTLALKLVLVWIVTQLPTW